MGLEYTFAGFVVGFIIGFTGVGGGSLMTPILVLVFRIPPAIAVGTDLLYAALTKGSGVFVHHRIGSVDWTVVRLLSLGSIPASLCTVLVLDWLRRRGVNYDGVMTTTLSVALILTSLVIIFKERLVILSRREELEFLREIHRRFQKPMTVVCGLMIGVLVTLSSVGAGAIGGAILFLLYPRMPVLRIVGTDLAHAVPLTAIAGLGHLHLGTVDFLLLGSLLLGSLPGIWLGSHAGVRLPEKVVRPVLALMLMGIGVRFAF
ncbi:MAG: sulfite exporter TauE/SafE family protein [Gammaproteobacteria bacterium]|nr:MAG: sulfite exporter TauE/SafE family protein [Gammaproteobacteria bacterium]